MLKIKRLFVKNFRSYGNSPSEVSFDENCIIGTVGINGIGKSSFFSIATHFALFGENIKGKIADLVNDVTQKNLAVEMDILNDSTSKLYTIKRYLKPEKNELYINGELQDTGMYKADFNEYIIGLLKLDKLFFKKFVNNNILTSMNFLNAPKGEKQKIFNYLFDLDNINNLKSFMKEKKKNVEKENVSIQSVIRELDVKLEGKEESLSNLVDLIASMRSNYDDMLSNKKKDSDRRKEEAQKRIEAIKIELSSIEYKTFDNKHLEGLLEEQNFLNEAKYKADTVKANHKKYLLDMEVYESQRLAVKSKKDEIYSKIKLLMDKASIENPLAEKSSVESEYNFIDKQLKSIAVKVPNYRQIVDDFKTIEYCESCPFKSTSLLKDVPEMQARLVILHNQLSVCMDKEDKYKNYLTIKNLWTERNKLLKSLKVPVKVNDVEFDYKMYDELTKKTSSLRKESELVRQINAEAKMREANLNRELAKYISEYNATLKEDYTKALKDLELSISANEFKQASMQDDIDQIKSDMATKKVNFDAHMKELNYLTFLLAEVIDNGQIIKYIIDSNIGVIEKLVNIYLKRFNFPQVLKLKYIDDLELEFSNGKPFEEFSDGEMLRVKMSFSFAFLLYLKELNRNNLNFLVLDEIISSSADDSMIDEVFNVLEEFKKDMTIVVITHDDRIKDKFDRVFEIEKGVFSKIKEISALDI